MMRFLSPGLVVSLMTALGVSRFEGGDRREGFVEIDGTPAGLAQHYRHENVEETRTESPESREAWRTAKSLLQSKLLQDGALPVTMTTQANQFYSSKQVDFELVARRNPPAGQRD